MTKRYDLKARISSLAIVGLAIAGCNTTIGEGQREQIVSGCVASAQQSGMPTNQVQQFCECSADQMIEQKMSMTDALDKTKAEGVARACVTQLMGGAGTVAQ